MNLRSWQSYEICDRISVYHRTEAAGSDLEKNLSVAKRFTPDSSEDSSIEQVGIG